jgi:copper chaperone CopZ
MDLHSAIMEAGGTGPGVTRLTMAVHGLGRDGRGAVAVEWALGSVPGVLQAFVSPATEMAYVRFRTKSTNVDRLVRAVRDAGFRAGEVQVR